jgi:AbrB family looped-hinge helix DNA binding protein
MTVVTVSPKYQVVIPLEARQAIGVKPGQKMRVITYNSLVVLVPVRPVQEARGKLSGMDVRDYRDEVDEER